MRFLKILLLFAASLCIAEEENVLAITEGEPSSNVHGCVSALTGDLFVRETNTIVRGAEPIPLSINYISRYSNQLLGGWLSGQYFGAKATNVGHFIFVPESNGTLLAYWCTAEKKKKHPEKKIYTVQFQDLKGMTNCARGEISARHNLKNNRLVMDGDRKFFRVFTSDGKERLYQKTKLHDELYTYYRLIKEILPNGHIIGYGYNKDGLIEQITTKNPKENKVYAWAHYSYVFEDDRHPDCHITTSDGRYLSLRYHEQRLKKRPSRFYLKQITGTELPEENIAYYPETKASGSLLQGRLLPDGRNLTVTYQGNQVSGLHAAAGPNGEMIPIHRFVYFPGEIGKQGGSTDVYDAQDNKTTYRYSPQLLLEAIEYYTKQGNEQSLHHVEKLVWGESTSKSGGQLIKKSLLNNKGERYFSKDLAYDEAGNILEEKLSGNLSGQAQNETYVKTQTYSKDGRNLLLSQEEEKGKATYLSYLPNTDLIASKLICNGDKIIIRHFFEYDEDNILVREMIDDGSTPNSSDLSAVTERRITVITPRKAEPFVGLPEIIEEKYLENGHERLLKKTILSYSPQGKIDKKEIYDAQGTFRYALTVKYDTKGRPYEETNALGQIATTAYDANNNPLFHRDYGADLSTTFTYDKSNRLIEEKESAPHQRDKLTHHTYDTLHHKISATNPFNHKTDFLPDAFGHILKTIHPETLNPSGSPFRAETFSSYDIAGKEVSTTDAKGYTTQTTYNARGKPISITHPDGHIEQFIYFTNGNLKAAIDQEGNTTSYTYDVLDRVISKEIASSCGELLSRETSTYNAFHLISKTDAENNLTSFEYDGAGRKIAETTNQLRTEYTYDPLGQVHSVKQSSLLTKTTYDLLNRPVEEKKEGLDGTLFSILTYAYDQAGNLASITRNIAGKPAKEGLYYDAFKRCIKETDALDQTTLIDYDETFRNSQGQTVLKKTTTDPALIKTIEVFDALNRLVTTEKKNNSDQTISLETYRYDENGNLSRQINTLFSPLHPPRTIETAWEYGPLNRLHRLTEANTKTTKYTYTPRGFLEQIIKPNNVVLTHTYDPLGRQTALISSDNTCHYTYGYNRIHQLISSTDALTHLTTRRTYDPQGNLLSETLPSRHTLTSTYDPLNRRTRLILPDNSSIAYIYDAAYLRTVSRYSPTDTLLYTHSYTKYDLSDNLLEEQLISNLGVTTYTVDPLERIQAFTSPFYTQTIPLFDPVGNIKKILWQTHLDHDTSTYTYDDLSQLTEEKGLFSHTLTYDSHYNRLKKDNDIYTINPLNQISKTNTALFTYDPNGNPIQKNNTHYTYDALDRLTEITEEGKYKLTFTYDSWHRRQTKTTYAWNNTLWEEKNTLIFLYDDQNEIGAIDDSGTITELRILGATPQAEIRSAIALELDQKVYAPIHDLCGNITTLISIQTRRPAEHYRYNAFGEEKTYTTTRNPWRFSSKRTDQETNLIYYGRRYYDPSLGRWLTPDPQGLTHSPNLYTFVLNNPLTHLDPYGLEAEHRFFSTDFTGVAMRFNQKEDILGQATRDAAIGIAHGTGRFVASSVTDLHSLSRSAYFLTDDNINLSRGFRDLYNTNNNILSAGDRFMQSMLPANQNSAIYQAARTFTTTGLEIAPLASIGYGATKGIIRECASGGMAFNKFAGMPVRISQLAKNETALLNFTETAGRHMFETERRIPMHILDEVIKSPMAIAKDPQSASNAVMHYSQMRKNGTLYNVEVLYDETTNTISHFQYTQKSTGPLKKIPKL